MSLVTRGLGASVLVTTAGLGPDSAFAPFENVSLPFGFVLTADGIYTVNEETQLSLGFALSESNSAVLTADPLVESGFGLVVADTSFATESLLNELGFALSESSNRILTEGLSITSGFSLDVQSTTIRVESALLNLGFSLSEIDQMFANESIFLDSGFFTALLINIPGLARKYRSFPKGPNRQMERAVMVGPVRIPNQEPVSNLRARQSHHDVRSSVHQSRKIGKVKGLPDKIPNQRPRR